MQPSLPQMSHVIFDLDGLLIDTESLYTKVFDELCMRWVGKHFDFSAKQLMMGRRRVDALNALKEKFSIPLSIEEIEAASLACIRKMLPVADFMPGAERLVVNLHKHGIPMAIATGSDEESYACKVRRKKEFFDKYFEHVVLSSDPDVKHGKPAPDIFLIAASRFKTPPVDYSRCVVFEDAFSGIQAALSAGMCAVWVPSHPEQDTSLLPAHVILPSLEHFDPECFGLPAFDSASSSPSSNSD